MMKDSFTDPSQEQTRRGSFIRTLLSWLWRILLFPVFSPQHCRRPSRPRPQETPAVEQSKGKWYLPSGDTCRRVLFGTAMRLLATPLVLLICLCVLVYASIHPTVTPAKVSPDVIGLYYETVSFHSFDKTLLQGWYVPSLKAEELITEGDKALRRQRPGVVLCHDLGANRSQLVALAGYLHYQGFELLLFDFRACGDSGGGVQTFGLSEREDVLAAVRYLQDLPRVDPQRIAVVGQGMGGAAVLAAAGMNPQIRAVVAADLDTNLQRAVERKLGETMLPAQLCSSSFVWGCRTYFRVSDPHFNLVHYAEMLSQEQQMLLFYRPRNASLTQSAMEILSGGSEEHVNVKPIDSITTCLLTDMEHVAPDIGEFLINKLGS